MRGMRDCLVSTSCKLLARHAFLVVLCFQLRDGNIFSCLSLSLLISACQSSTNAINPGHTRVHTHILLTTVFMRCRLEFLFEPSVPPHFSPSCYPSHPHSWLLHPSSPLPPPRLPKPKSAPVPFRSPSACRSQQTLAAVATPTALVEASGTGRSPTRTRFPVPPSRLRLLPCHRHRHR